MCVRFCMSMARIGCLLDRAPTYDNVHLWVSGLPFLDDDFEFHPSTHILGAILTCGHCLEKGIGTRCTTCMIPVASTCCQKPNYTITKPRAHYFMFNHLH